MARSQPEGQQDEIDDGVEGLGGVHGPGDGEAERGDLKADEQDDDGGEHETGEAGMDARERREAKEDESLDGGEGRAAEHLAEHDCGA